MKQTTSEIEILDSKPGADYLEVEIRGEAAQKIYEQLKLQGGGWKSDGSLLIGKLGTGINCIQNIEKENIETYECNMLIDSTGNVRGYQGK